MIKLNPMIVYRFGTWLNLITPTITVAIIVKPANDAYVTPIGISFMTIDNVYMQSTIVIAVIILGWINVKPSALFAKLFEVTPKTTAKIKII
mgnify:CR=1 FL=1